MIVLCGLFQDKEVYFEECVKVFLGYWNVEIFSSEIKGEWMFVDKKWYFFVVFIYYKFKNFFDIVLVMNMNDVGGYDFFKEIDCGNMLVILVIKLYCDGKFI